MEHHCKWSNIINTKEIHSTIMYPKLIQKNQAMTLFGIMKCVVGKVWFFQGCTMYVSDRDEEAGWNMPDT